MGYLKDWKKAHKMGMESDSRLVTRTENLMALMSVLQTEK